MTDNKMLLKEFSKIYASCNKAKQGAIVEISKIDEKYRKLAEKEKEQLNELVKALESQMEMYGRYLGLVKDVEEPVQEESQDIVEQTEEPVIEDTIFPENNEPENTEEAVEEKTEEPKKNGMTVQDIVSGLESAGIVNIDEVVKEEEKEETVVLEDIPEVSSQNMEWPDNDNLKVGEDGWPEWPEA